MDDLFGEPRVQIKDNQILEKACNRILLMVKRDPTLLSGNTIGEIDRRIYAEILWEDGVQLLCPNQKNRFIEIVQKTQESDVYTRARRYLAETDNIRLPSKAIQNAERLRSRISGAMK